MEEVYDLHKHTISTVIYFGKNEVHNLIFDNWKRFYLTPTSFFKDACITYDKQKTNVLNWGNSKLKEDNIDQIYIDDLMDGLYRTFKKSKDNRSENDLLYVKAVSDYIRLLMEIIIIELELRDENKDKINYSLIVPSEWEEEIREDLIRPIFIEAGLILEEDHTDRLLYFSDVESVFYGLGGPINQTYSFKVGQNIILCQLTPEKGDEASIRLDLVKIGISLFSLPDSMLFPEVVSSLTLSISYADIKNCIKTFLKAKMFSVQDQIIEEILDDIYAEDLFEQLTYNKKNDQDNKDKENKDDKVDEEDKNRPRLCKAQVQIIKSVNPSDICAEIGKTLLHSMKDITSSNLMKVYELLIIEDQYSSELKLSPFLLKWIKYMLRYSMRSLNSITKMTELNVNRDEIDLDNLLYGAANGVLEAIQNADMYSRPRIVSVENSVGSSSIFVNSNPNAIINIDISLESTSLMYSRLNEDGLVEEIFDHNHFTKDMCLLPLKRFYKVSSSITLRVNESFISFAEKYLLSDLKDFSIDEDIVLKIQAILNKDNSNEQLFISTQKQKYIKAFILIYIIYIKELISNNLPAYVNTGDEHTKIGYVVSIEKILLDNVIGNKEDFHELIFASSLLLKDETSKKLRIITQGEGILPVIQQHFKIDFPLKCYFLLAQLHEDYVQLIVNQVVTDEKEQEAIILQDEIVSMRNIYDTLCLYMWNNITRNYNVIEMCDMHCGRNGNQILELFLSQEVKTEFMSNLQIYISGNILNKSVNAQSSEKYNIHLSSSCSCKVNLTVDDIIEISFKPAIQNIASIVSSSLINRELFGKYIDIQYMFNLISFNKNPQFLNTFTRILNEKIDDFNQEQGIDTICFTVPEQPDQILQSALGKVPLLYKAFQIGTLHQVYSNNFAFTVDLDTDAECFLYKTKRSDKEGIKFDYTAFPLFRKGDIINNEKSKKTFYLTLQKSLERDFIWICYCRFKEFDALEYSEQLIKYKTIQEAGTDTIYPHKNDLKIGHDIPIIVSAVYQPHSSSLSFTARMFGQDDENTNAEETGESMTLCRF